MDRRYSEVTVLLFLFIIICAAETIYIFRSKKEKDHMYAELTKVFNDAVEGKNIDLPYDESVLSALYDRIVRYININNSKLEAAKAEKESLQMIISNVSHQISQPVSDVCLYSELLSEKEIQDENIRMMVTDIRRQSSKLKFVFEVMLKSSRLEAGIITISNIKRQRIIKLIADTIPDLITAITQKNIDVNVNISEDISAQFDFNWTKEAVYNIIENAVKYTPSDGDISIQAVSYETYVRLDISDTGIGIAKEEYTNIFKRFYRSENVKGYNGLGIGLYLSREIISRENGYIKVSSVPGKGSTFSVFLPC